MKNNAQKSYKNGLKALTTALLHLWCPPLAFDWRIKPHCCMISRNDIYAITFDKNYSNGERERGNKKREKQRDKGKELRHRRGETERKKETENGKIK
jgi:hypothetical protein